MDDLKTQVEYQQKLFKDDIYALNLIQPLLGNTFLPFTNSSIRPVCMATILNDIVINGRKSIIEFGSGISTILIGRLIKNNNLQSKIISVEHFNNWVEVMQSIIKEEKLENIITIVHAPLEKCSLAIDSNLWYSEISINKIIAGQLFDMVIIDGPPAYEASKKYARYPAYPFIKENLSERSVVYLDDSDREGEKDILRRWEKDYSAKFDLMFETIACSIKGPSFNTGLFKY